MSVVRPARLERATFWFVARRSIQLSYGRFAVGLKAILTRWGFRPNWWGVPTRTASVMRRILADGGSEILLCPS